MDFVPWMVVKSVKNVHISNCFRSCFSFWNNMANLSAVMFSPIKLEKQNGAVEVAANQFLRMQLKALRTEARSSCSLIFSIAKKKLHSNMRNASLMHESTTCRTFAQMSIKHLRKL